MRVNRADVVVLGGGLAGLTFALQLRSRLPEIDIVVLEREAEPAPPATHKIGESTVEIGAHYLDTVLRLGDHLRESQLKKFGFRFFFSDGRRDVDSVTELGASDYLRTPGYQLDRGILENHLVARAAASGIRVITGAVVSAVELGKDAPHRVSYQHDGEANLEAKWVVDASGRAGLLRRKLGLQVDNGHYGNAVWFRIGARIAVDDWSADETWHARIVRRERWLSTNHLVGPGYWAWLIPLSSGAHSIGIVADEKLHPLREMNSFARAREWMTRHQPRLAEAIAPHADKLMDFAAMRRFSYGCRRVFSPERWALTGEAGLFLDPFYSPGTDFIAISNTYICELIARDAAGQSIAVHAGIFEQIYFSFYESTLELFKHQYPMFGNPQVMPAKVIWDYTYYWGILAQFFFQRRLTDLASLSELREELQGAQKLNTRVQKLLREWGAVDSGINAARMLDQAALPWFAELNRSLQDPLSESEFRARIRNNAELLTELAVQLADQAGCSAPELVADIPAAIAARSHYPALLFPAAAPGAGKG